MEQSIHNEIESLIKSNIIFRFGLELSNTHDSTRKDQIKKILKKYENNNDDQDVVREKREKMFEQINKDVYRQKWTKLSDFHKEIKIKEYASEKYTDTKLPLVLKFLIESLKEGKLKTEKLIEYDSKQSKIINIRNLVENDNGFEFEEKKKKSIKPLKNNIT